jgi:2-amino-4-hydroxy-6-hydroxymethyldihydropteridine diphosphokinase
MTPVYVAAGSNVEPEKHLAQAAMQILDTWPDAIFSAAYANKAVGFDGPDFINLVVGFHTAHPFDFVIGRLRAIETRCGRPRYAPKWASRTMDLDVLMFGDRIEKTSDYTLPRPDLLKRPYMLGPMAEIAPDVKHPIEGRTIAELWAAFDGDGHSMTPVPIPGMPDRQCAAG